MSNTKLFIKYIVITALFTNCSASTGSRYGDGDKPDGNKDNGNEYIITEDFDITPYKINIIVESPDNYPNTKQDAWFDYDNFSDGTYSTIHRKIIGTVDGYRIVVIATDEIEEANRLRDILNSEVKRHDVYISFEPPFYKVKVGDFISLAETNDLKFKLNQLGYKEARIVQESINLFEE